MSKSDQRNIKAQTEQQRSQNNAQGAATNTQLQGMLETSKATSASLLPGVSSNYGKIADTGGYDPSVLGDIRGTYGDLAKTGGIDEAGATAMRNRSAEAARSTYDIAGSQAQRAASATGGYGDTSAAITGDLARKGSQAAATAVTGTDANIAQLRQSGRIAGAGGLQASEQAQVGNKLAATGGQANIYGLSVQETHATVDAILRNYQATGQLDQQSLAILTNLANQPGVFDKIVGTIGALGGAAAGVLGGIGPKKGSSFSTADFNNPA